MLIYFIKLMKKHPKKGFTLIEVLVSVSIFSIALAAILGVFNYAMKIQTKLLNTQEVLESSSGRMEYLSRNLRMAIRDELGICLNGGFTYDNSVDNTIRFIGPDNICQEIYLDSGQLKIKKSSDNTKGNLPVIAQELTSSNLNIRKFEFNVVGDDMTDDSQPRVTVYMEMESKNSRDAEKAEIILQTTISQRNLDI